MKKINPTEPDNRVATLGPDLTHSVAAAREWAGKKSLIMMDTIEAVFEAVTTGVAAFGVVPLENSLQGAVHETAEALTHYKVERVATIARHINHVVALPAGATSADIIKIMSHPQALHQCSKILEKMFPSAEWQTVNSTAAAFQQADLTTAVIGTQEAADKYNFTVLNNHAENDLNNITTFIVISKKSA